MTDKHYARAHSCGAITNLLIDLFISGVKSWSVLLIVLFSWVNSFKAARQSSWCGNIGRRWLVSESDVSRLPQCSSWKCQHREAILRRTLSLSFSEKCLLLVNKSPYCDETTRYKVRNLLYFFIISMPKMFIEYHYYNT